MYGTIPLQQNIGAPCGVLVKRGDKVLTGQKIGDSDKANIYGENAAKLLGM